MADGEHSLPPNEELFEQPMEQEPQQYELPRADQDQGYHGVPEDPQASGGATPHDMEHHYPVQEDHLANSGYYEPPPPTATNQVFQPTPQQNFVAPQPRDAQNYEEQGAGDAGGGGAAVNGEDPPGDADTVWIDSDSDDDPEAEFLRANFGLTYSDHNYDCPDPADRVIHPQEGPFKVIGGLSEDGRIVKEWMPDGYGPPHREGYVPTEEDEEEATAATVKEEPLQQQHHQEYQNPPLQQQQVHPMRQTMRPVVAAQPFSIGGNQVEYAEPRMPPRGVSVAPRDTQFRIINELGHPMMTSSQQHHGIRAQSVSSTRVLNNNPHATIIRQQPQHPQTLYQAPQGSLRGTPLQSQQQRLGGATPGSYQHIVNPSPSGNFGATIRRQVPAQGAPRGVGGPGIVVSSNQLGPRPGVRPVHVTRPMTDNLDREFIEHPMPLPPQGPPATAQIRRAPADVAPHRMTAEQRLEQQQLNRQRAQFPMQRGGVQQPQQQATTRVPAQQAAIIGRGRGGVMAVGSPGHEDLLRSPQRGIQERQPVVCEPRKFQVRVTDTYSAPIPKASDQLPAQLTEDPPEEVQKVEEPTDDAPEASDVKQEIKSPSRLTSATSSPVKSHGIQQKPTPPHRMTQEEKNAHLAKLSTDKEKPTNLNTLPLRGVHHQDDTLAVVQSVFESNKPRQPDTPKDKEAISKIADLLRFSAEEFSGASGSGTSNTRQRSISGGANRAQNYGSAPMVQPHHQPHLHHQQQQQPPNPMDDEARRKRHGSGRYDNNMGIGGQNPMHQMRSPQHSAHIQQQAGEPEPNLDPPIRPRGRPRGTTQQRVARFGNAPETLAPHRAAGGARTLPPRQVQQHQEPPAPPPRAAMSANSDSESEAVDSESWEMRCHCDMDHGDGETVECESCKTWQHMACMGLNMNSDTTKYKCEQCQPRRLPVTKAEAIRTQKKILEKLRRAAERDRRNKRKSEPVEPVKPVVQQSRKSAPMPLQPQPAPQSHRIAQLNEYSRQATALLNSMQQTAGADQLLEESRRHNKARRMFVEENVEALVTMELVQIRQVILEVNGYVAMSNEMKRQPGGGNCIFMYDGLMKGTAGEDMGSGQELVCIDTKKKGNDTKFTRRSCIPNCVLKHVLGSQATLGIMVVATKDILRNTEVTLPFDADWKESDVPLDCAEHMRDIHSCPFEQERRRAAGDRQRVKDTEKRRIEEAKRADEERRRLEEEVRRERAAKTKQLEEEAEKERLELERAEKERKAKEREEAKKKREQEKKKEQEKEGSSSKQPEGITSRDALRVQQAEERFRRQEEEEKRREARRSRSKSQTPKPEDVPTSSDSAVPSTSDSQANRRQSSRNQQKKEMPEKAETPEVKEAPVAEDTPTTSGTRSSKRMKTPAAIFVAASAANSAAKKPRYSTAVRVEPTTTISPAPNVTRKRGAAASSLTPAAKRANAGRPEPPMYRLGDLAEEMNENAAVNSMVLEFEPPEVCTNESSVSDWAKEAKANEEVLKAKKAAKSSSSSSSKPVEPPPKKAATPIVKKKDVAAAPEVVDTSKTPRRRGEVKEAPKTVEIATKEKPSEAAPEDKNVAGPAPPPPARAASPKKSAAKPVEKPEKPSEIHGMEREASESAEGSVEKELTPTTPSAAKKAPKKLTLADYATRRSKREEPGTSAASAPSPSSASTSTRRGFIPSTDGLGGNVQLSAIPLDNHPANASITTTAPSHQPPPPPPPASSSAVSITSPSTRSRARAAASESADETPAEHQMSLIDRIAHMFPPPPPPQSSNDTSNSSRPRTRPTRWNV